MKPSGARSEVVGATLSRGGAAEDFVSVAAKALYLRWAVNNLGNSPTELSPAQQCADVSKCDWGTLPAPQAATHDRDLRAAINMPICGTVGDGAWAQATTGVTDGWFGVHMAAYTALPSSVASMVAAGALVEAAGAFLVSTWLLSASAIVVAFQSCATTALDALAAERSDYSGAPPLGFLDAANGCF